jgi:hypothetical protein
MYNDLNHFPKLLFVYEPSHFLLSVSKSQSLNTCKRVGVSGHIPKLLGTWGLSTIILGKSVIQERQSKRGNLWG